MAIVNVALPLKWLVGVYNTPLDAANVALMAAGEPVRVTTAEPLLPMFAVIRPFGTLLSNVRVPLV